LVKAHESFLIFYGQKPLFPQKLSHKFTSNIKPVVRRLVCFAILTTWFSLKAATQLNFRKNADSLFVFQKGVLLPQNFYNQHKGFFCKKEDQLQKTTGLNLFIRLGTKAYVDYIEQKPNSLAPKR